MAAGALERFGADTAVAITGIAGPGGNGGKPVGTVCFTVKLADGPRSLDHAAARGRSDVRERSTTVAMHLLPTHVSDTKPNRS